MPSGREKQHGRSLETSEASTVSLLSSVRCILRHLRAHLWDEKGEYCKLQMPFVLKQHTMNERLHKNTSFAGGNKFAVSNTHHGTPDHSSHAYAGVAVLSSLHPFLRNPAFCVLPVPGVMEMRWVSPEKSPLGPFAHTSGLKSRRGGGGFEDACVCVYTY